MSPTQMLFDVWSGQQRLMSDNLDIKAQLRDRHSQAYRVENDTDQRLGRIEAALSTLKNAGPPPAAAPTSATAPAIGGWEVALKRPVPWIILLLALLITGKLEVVIRFIEALAKFAEHAS